MLILPANPAPTSRRRRKAKPEHRVKRALFAPNPRDSRPPRSGLFAAYIAPSLAGEGAAKLRFRSPILAAGAALLVHPGVVRPVRHLEIGRDYLDLCSSRVFDKRAKTVTLSCR
jgi:hypothetical protein